MEPPSRNPGYAPGNVFAKSPQLINDENLSSDV